MRVALSGIWRQRRSSRGGRRENERVVIVAMEKREVRRRFRQGEMEMGVIDGEEVKAGGWRRERLGFWVEGSVEARTELIRVATKKNEEQERWGSLGRGRRKEQERCG
jgi:hypothetical protein